VSQLILLTGYARSARDTNLEVGHRRALTFDDCRSIKSSLSQSASSGVVLQSYCCRTIWAVSGSLM